MTLRATAERDHSLWLVNLEQVNLHETSLPLTGLAALLAGPKLEQA
jgi:hypothetical protein